METIANRIKQGLSIRNMKQADLVEKTKIGKSSISTYISGAYEPKQRNIYKIAKALDVNEAWLMGYDVPMEREASNTVNSNDKDNILLNSFNKLNEEGKNEAIKRVQELTELSKYKKEEGNKLVELPSSNKETENEVTATKEDNVIELPKESKKLKDISTTIAAHDDDLTSSEKEEMDKRILEFLNNKKN